MTLGIRREQRLEDVREDLDLLVHLDARGMNRLHGRRHGHDEAASARQRFRLARQLLPERRRLLEVRARPLVVAPQVRDRRPERQEAREVRHVWRLARQLEPLLDPAPRLVHAPALPRGLGREHGRPDERRPVAALLEDLRRLLDLAKRGLHVPGEPARGGQDRPRLPGERLAPGGLLVQEVQDGARRADRLLGAQGLERLLRQLQSVLDRLLGKVALRAAVQELRVDALQPSRVAPLELLGVAAMERAPAAPRQSRVEDVAQDAAPEREAVPARGPFFFQEAVREEPLDSFLQAFLRPDQELEVAELEGLAEDGGDREHLAVFLAQPVDAPFHGLLDRDRQRLGPSPRAREPERTTGLTHDAVGIHERAHELACEVGIPLRGLEELLGQGILHTPAEEGLEEEAALGRRERLERDRDEPPVALEALDQLRQRMPLVDLRAAERAHEERGRGSDAPEDVLQRLERDVCSV